MDAEYNQVLVKESFEDGLAQGYSEGKAEGEAIGRVEGEAKGRAETNRAVAKAMLNDGVTISKVSLYTGLSIKELQQL